MAKQVRVRRDTLSNLNGVIPADGELAYNLTDDRIHIGDGATLGGIPHANFRDILNQKFEYATTGGTANAITLTLPYALGSYGTGVRIRFKATTTNAGATTINVSGLGTKNLYKVVAGSVGNIVAGDVVNGGIYEIVYDGTQFQLANVATAAGLTTVKQGDLSTATATFSGSANTSLTASLYFGTGILVMAGGQYGMQAESISNTAVICGFWDGNQTASYSASKVPWANNTGAFSVGGRQRYITTSPPYDLGEGEDSVGGFLYLLLDSDGNIIGHSFAESPPWANNGPTSVRPTRTCPFTGKKYKKVVAQRSFEEIMDGAAILYEEQEITHDVKNADMDLIPSPFLNMQAGEKAIIIDPSDKRIRRMMDLQNSGDEGSEEVVKQILSGNIRVDNTAIKRKGYKGPKGIPMHKMEFKYSGRNA